MCSRILQFISGTTENREMENVVKPETPMPEMNILYIIRTVKSLSLVTCIFSLPFFQSSCCSSGRIEFGIGSSGAECDVPCIPISDCVSRCPPRDQCVSDVVRKMARTRVELMGYTKACARSPREAKSIEEAMRAAECEMVRLSECLARMQACGATSSASSCRTR